MSVSSGVNKYSLNILLITKNIHVTTVYLFFFVIGKVLSRLGNIYVTCWLLGDPFL